VEGPSYECSWLSVAALRRAYARVKENHGCAGADGITLAGFESGLDGQCELLKQQVETREYWAWPLRRVVIEKHPGSTETRTLCVPAVRDRVLQTAAASALEPVLEPEFEDCSFAYRRGRGVRMAVERVHKLLTDGYGWIVDADIENFFDSIPVDVALGRLRPYVKDETLLSLAGLWLDASVWDGTSLRRTGKGLFLGLVISPMLANLCLDHLDETVEAAGLRMVRYGDDFVILTKSRKQAERALALAESEIQALRLRLNQSKTHILRSADGMKFLGIVFLKDMLLQPFGKRKRLKVIDSAPAIPPGWLPDSERRPLRRYLAY
jgi:RNA-directed DNA polymerase